jgi:hypothetical protein
MPFIIVADVLEDDFRHIDGFLGFLDFPRLVPEGYTLSSASLRDPVREMLRKGYPLRKPALATGRI